MLCTLSFGGFNLWILIPFGNLKTRFFFFFFNLLWPPDGKNWLTGKDPDAGRGWRQEEKGMRGWDGWRASSAQWTRVHVNSGRPWRTGKPGMLQSTGLWGVRHDRVGHVSQTWTATYRRICLTILCWSLSCISMNQPQVHMSPLALCFAYGGLYVSVLLSSFVPPPPSPLCPQACSLCLCLHRCLQTGHRYRLSRFHIYTLITDLRYLFFSFCLTSLYIIGFSFIHFIRTDSNVLLFVDE